MSDLFILSLLVIAVAGIAAGCALAISGYSSAGAFSVASACVGVLGTLASQRRNGERPTKRPIERLERDG